MKNKPAIARVFLLSCLLALSGCISLPSSAGKDKVPLSLYTLHPRLAQKAEISSQPKASGVIVMPKPEVPAGLETERIALYLQQGRKLDYYADAAWSGSLDDLLQDFIIQSGRRDLPGKIVGTPDLSDSAAYRMVVKITDFQPVYQGAPDKPPRLEAGMTVTLLTLPDEKVKVQFSLKKSAAASANRLTVITKGMESLLQSLTDEAFQKIAPYLAGPEKNAAPVQKVQKK